MISKFVEIRQTNQNSGHSEKSKEIHHIGKAG